MQTSVLLFTRLLPTLIWTSSVSIQSISFGSYFHEHRPFEHPPISIETVCRISLGHRRCPSHEQIIEETNRSGYFTFASSLSSPPEGLVPRFNVKWPKSMQIAGAPLKQWIARSSDLSVIPLTLDRLHFQEGESTMNSDRYQCPTLWSFRCCVSLGYTNVVWHRCMSNRPLVSLWIDAEVLIIDVDRQKLTLEDSVQCPVRTLQRVYWSLAERRRRSLWDDKEDLTALYLISKDCEAIFTR